MILVIDNYDSFTYNIVQYLQLIGAEVVVRRNDQIGLNDIWKISPSGIVISPGPGRPERAGICVDLIHKFWQKIPILGVCLGHQAIAIAFGGVVKRAKFILHGKTSLISHDGKGLFRGIKNPFRATRYHSLAIDGSSLPPWIEITSWSDDGEVMGIRHKEYPVEGVQFHPESILTEGGIDLLKNFVEITHHPFDERKGGERRDKEGH